MFYTLACLMPALLLSFFPSTGAPRDGNAPSELLIRPNAADWRCHSGDDPRWAQPDFDDHEWPPCSPDSLAPPGMSWSRLHVRLPEPARSGWSAGAVLPPAGVLYANGSEIASWGRLGDKPQYRVPTYRIIPLPPLYYQGAAEVVFAERMQHSTWTRATMGFGAIDLQLGPEPVLRQPQELYAFQRLAGAVPNAVEALLALLLGAYVLRLWSAQRSQWEYFWFTAIAAFFNFRAIAHLITIDISMDARLANALNTGFAPEVLLPPFFWTLFQRRVPKTVAVYTLAIFTVRLLGTFWFPGLGALPWIWLATIPCMLLPLIVTFQEVRMGNHEAKVLALPMFFYAAVITWVNLFLAYQSFILAGGPAVFGRANYPEWHLGAVSLGWIEIGQTVFLLTTAVILADRARRTNIEQARLAGEISAAQQLQQLLVPPPSVTVGEYRIESAYVPSEQVGGDFYQLIPNGDGSLLIVLGDVSGKGLKAAMVVSLLAGALQRIRNEDTRPLSVLRSLNEVLYGRTEGGFVTCCCANLDSTGQLTVANAGHLTPYHNGQEIETPPALPLGIDADAHWIEAHLDLQPGDRIVWISDGVVEARNGNRDLLGFQRAKELATLSVSEIARAAQQFGQEDDITVVSVTRQSVAVLLLLKIRE